MTRRLKVNTLLRDAFDPWFTQWQSRGYRPFGPDMKDVHTLHLSEPSKLEVFRRPTASWHKMLVTQPAIWSLTIWPQEESSDSIYEARYDLIVVSLLLNTSIIELNEGKFDGNDNCIA